MDTCNHAKPGYSCSVDIPTLVASWRPIAVARDIVGGALGGGGGCEHVAVERVVGLVGGVEAEAALAVLADDDAGSLVVEAVDGVSLGHGFPFSPAPNRAGVLL